MIKSVYQTLSVLILSCIFYTCTSPQNTKNTTRNDKIIELDSLLSFENKFELVDSLSAIEISKKIAHDELDTSLVNLYLVRIKALNNASKYDEARAINIVCEELCRKLRSTKKLLKCNQNEALYYYYIADYKECISKYHELLPKLYAAKEYATYTKSKANMAWAYFENQDYAIAKELTQEALGDAEKYGFSSLFSDYFQRLGSIYTQLAIINTDRKPYEDSALFYFRKSESLLLKDSNMIEMSYLYTNMGGFYSSIKKYNEAIAQYTQAIKIQNDYEMELELGYSYSNIGLVYQRAKSYMKAETYLNEAYAIAERFNSLDLKSTVVKNLAVLFKESGNYKASSEKYATYIDLYTRNINEQVEQSNKVLFYNYNLAKKEKENILLKHNKLKLEKRNGKVVFFSTILFLTLLAGFVIYQQRRKRLEIIATYARLSKEEEVINTAKNMERKRISKDLHDNLGAYASAILATAQDMNQSNSVNQLAREKLDLINVSAQHILSNLRETIVLLNNDNQTFTEFIDGFKTTALKLLKNYETIHLEINENFEYNGLLTPTTTVHLKAILLELIQNSIKHSKCSLLYLSVLENENSLQIAIADNGIGYDSETAKNGSGLTNIKWRIAQIKAEITIASSPKNGCKTIVVLKKN